MGQGDRPLPLPSHLWVLENRLQANEEAGFGYYWYYGDNTYRGLILGEGQFSGMSGVRALDPASYFENPDEKKAWEDCVDEAYKFYDQGIG